MITQPARYLPDGQLGAILDQGSIWVVIGSGGQILCFATTLRSALEKAAALGAAVTALVRLPPENIVVLLPQMDRLRTIMAIHLTRDATVTMPTVSES